MSKKHFIALADFLKHPEGSCEPFTPKQVEHLADFCKAQNPRFNRERFLDYVAGLCGPCGGSIKA